MENQNNKAAVRTFAGALASALSDSLGHALGLPWRLEILDGQEVPPRNTKPVQFSLKAEGGLQGECFVEFYEPQATELAAKLNSEGESADADPGKALAAALSSATGALSAALAAKHGEVTFRVESVTGLAFGGMLVLPLATPGDRSGGSMQLYFDTELIEALSAAPAAEAPADSGDRSVHPANLKLVMDVELNVSLRFGQRQLPLREVLELGSGSVIELDRMVDEPVELLLDGKLVARGEAVIVDGNYGLRVTEIPQAMETHFLH